MELRELTLQSSDGFYQRKAWFRPGPDAPHRLGVLLDGEFYLERADVLPLLDGRIEGEPLPEMSWLLIASGGAQARHDDFTYNPRFARFIAEDAVGWARGAAGGLVGDRHVLGGLSLSGLAAGYIALVHNTLFSAALCQSGSFWHEPERFAALVEAHPPSATRFWLSVGDQETDVDVSHPPTGLYQSMSQIEGVQRACSALEHVAGAVHCHRYQGGHEFGPWRAEFVEALRWLLVPSMGERGL
ncbi:MAG: alpha/beta hydrolase-fold protein [Myxococcota bacterium]